MDGDLFGPWASFVPNFDTTSNLSSCLCVILICCHAIIYPVSFSIIFFPPLGSLYPIKFIKSNMWMWHQRHRQLCDLHFAYWYVRTMCVRAFFHSISWFLFCLLQWKLNVVHDACVSFWIADVFCFFVVFVVFFSSNLNCFAYDAMHLLDSDFSDD